MIQLEAKGKVLYCIAKEKLHDEDYDKFVPFVDEKIKELGKVRLYFEMKDFEGWTPKAMWRDVKFGFKDKEHIEKAAMVGDKKWEKWLTELMKPFTKADIKFFRTEERETAKKWIEQ